MDELNEDIDPLGKKTSNLTDCQTSVVHFLTGSRILEYPVHLTVK